MLTLWAVALSALLVWLATLERESPPRPGRPTSAVAPAPAPESARIAAPAAAGATAPAPDAALLAKPADPARADPFGTFIRDAANAGRVPAVPPAPKQAARDPFREFAADARAREADSLASPFGAPPGPLDPARADRRDGSR